MSYKHICVSRNWPRKQMDFFYLFMFATIFDKYNWDKRYTYKNNFRIKRRFIQELGEICMSASEFLSTFLILINMHFPKNTTMVDQIICRNREDFFLGGGEGGGGGGLHALVKICK